MGHLWINDVFIIEIHAHLFYGALFFFLDLYRPYPAGAGPLDTIDTALAPWKQTHGLVFGQPEPPPFFFTLIVLWVIGSIPPALARLRHLEDLRLQDNQLTGQCIFLSVRRYLLRFGS